MKIGLGLYRRMLTPENLRFARQCGCTHIVAHLVDYFQGGQLHGTDENTCWGMTPNRGKLWTEEEEVFIDEGDIDVLRVLRILRDCGYDGVLIPDHTPSLQCDAPWHAGMAYALGYLQAALRAVDA